MVRVLFVESFLSKSTRPIGEYKYNLELQNCEQHFRVEYVKYLKGIFFAAAGAQVWKELVTLAEIRLILRIVRDPMEPLDQM